jgi:hypothetical protein
VEIETFFPRQVRMVLKLRNLGLCGPNGFTNLPILAVAGRKAGTVVRHCRETRGISPGLTTK